MIQIAKSFFYLFLLSPLAFAEKTYFKLSPKQESIVFGSPSIGYFETTNSDFLPPTYKEPVAFYRKGKDLVCIERIHFKNPTPLNEVPQITLTGDFSSPFFLTNAYLEESSKRLILLLNKFGEVIWTYSPKDSNKGVGDDDKRTRTILPKVWSPNGLALLHPYAKSYFQIVDWKGNIEWEVKPPFPLHHDFIKISEYEFYSLGLSLQKKRKPWRFWQAPMSFLGTPLLHLKKAERKDSLTAEVLWDYLKESNPFFNSSWNWNEVDSAGKFWAGWDGSLAQHNYVHANSIDKSTEGLLLSLRNLSEVVLLSLNGKKKKTFTGDFFRQHHATFLKNGNILLFDNGKKESSLLELNFESSSPTHRFSPTPKIHSTRHGSAYELPNHNLLGFFPHTTPGGTTPNVLIEFDYPSRKEIARLEISLGYNAAGYRAEPVLTLPGTSPFNGKVPKCTIAAK